MKRFVLHAFACAMLTALQPTVFAQAAAQDWIPLQDGKSLAGWKAGQRPESWVVEEGAFVTRGGPSHLFYVGKVAKHDFRNFEFSAEVMTSPGANSGIYVHTKLLPAEDWPSAGYELQVINSNPPAEKMNGYIEHKMTGSIYAVRNTWVAPAKDNEWFNYRIRVVGKTIQTFINDKLICEYAEPAEPYRPKDKPGRLLGSGTFALQAHDPGSVVKYRNMKVRILPKDEAPPPYLHPVQDRELDQLITQASNDNIPLIDLAGEPFTGDAETFWRAVRRDGMTWGSELPGVPIASLPSSVVLIVDTDAAPNVELLKAAKAAGSKVVFSSGPSAGVSERRLKARLEAIKAAGLGWKDFWVPGKTGN
jgi:3-keto-disaccharide hydrolase